MAAENTEERKDDERSPKVCFVIGRPRSGTTVFKQMLGTHPAIVNWGEILNENHPRSYWNFISKQLAKDALAFAPSKSVSMFSAYVEYLRRQVAKENPKALQVIVDVKYDQASSIASPWHNVNAMPRLWSLIVENDWFVIDIHRRYVPALVISNHVAMHTNLYHLKSGEKAPPNPQRPYIDPDRFVDEVQSTRVAYKRVRNFFGKYAGYLRLDYEELFDSDTGSFTEATTKRVADHIGVDDVFDKSPQLRKILKRDPYANVQNGDELRAAVLAADAIEAESLDRNQSAVVRAVRSSAVSADIAITPPDASTSS